MKVAIMQPYFCPYIGYFQLINAVDKFVIYDNIEYSKRGWFNRNRILVNGTEKLFSIPLKKDSDFLNVDLRSLSPDSLKERKKILSQIFNSYKKAPFFSLVYPLLETLFLHNEDNLFKFIFNSINRLVEFIGIQTEIIVSSSLSVNHHLKGQDKVLAICENLQAKTYINAIGGKEIYEHDSFKNLGIDLFFIRSNSSVYNQLQEDFIPWLSIIDVLMFNGPERTKLLLEEYSLEQ